MRYRVAAGDDGYCRYCNSDRGCCNSVLGYVNLKDLLEMALQAKMIAWLQMCGRGNQN